MIRNSIASGILNFQKQYKQEMIIKRRHILFDLSNDLIVPSTANRNELNDTCALQMLPVDMNTLSIQLSTL